MTATVTLHWVHKRAGEGLRTVCGLAPVRDLAEQVNAGHGGPCPDCATGKPSRRFTLRNTLTDLTKETP